MTWGHMNGGGWTLMTALWLLIVVAATIVVVRALADRPAGIDGTKRAQGILADRFARGEIDTEEYRERLDELNRATGDLDQAR